MAESYPCSPQEVGRATQKAFNFCAAVRTGDIVLAADGATILGIGKVLGPYYYEPSSDFPHRRS
ncbi:MAG TPA: hypothetical protein VEZ12_07825, partial [Herpetosiphonaceae bacterium]|nr:hypothetical protein [Herpetosiphonaceae bacterium]